MSSWWSSDARSSSWRSSSPWNHYQDWHRGAGPRRQRGAGRQAAIDAEIANLVQGTQGVATDLRTYAEVASPPPSRALDASKEAQEARRRNALRLKGLIASRDALLPEDPCRQGIEDAIAQVRAHAGQHGESAASPGQVLDQAVRRTAELRVKATTARSQLEKAKLHLDKTTAELAAAEVELTKARSLAAGAPTTRSVLAVEVPAQIIAVREVLSQLSAMGFQVPPGQDYLSTALDRIWEITGPAPPALPLEPTAPVAGAQQQMPADTPPQWADGLLEDSTMLADLDQEEEEEEEEEEFSDAQIQAALARLPKGMRKRLVRKSTVKSKS